MANPVESIKVYNAQTKRLVAEMEPYAGMTYEEAEKWAFDLVDSFDRTALYDIEIQMGEVA